MAWPIRALLMMPVSCAETAADGEMSPTPIGGADGAAPGPGWKMSGGAGGTDGMAGRMDGGASGPQGGDGGICCGATG